MILKHIDWATFRVVVQRRGICAGERPSLSRFSFEWLMGKWGWRCIVGRLSSSVCLQW